MGTLGDAPRSIADVSVGQSLEGLGVCIVGINYGPDSTGIAPYTVAMAEAMQAAGARVHVITGIPHYPEWKVKDERYRAGSTWRETINDVEVTRIRHHVPTKTDLRGRGRMEASFFSGAARVVRLDRSDVVVAVTPSLAGLAAAVYGKRHRPLGVLVQDLTGNAAGESGTTGGLASRSIAKIEYSLLKSAERVGVITPEFGRILEGHGLTPSKLTNLPNFTHISPAVASKREARARLGWPQDEILAVHTGNIGMKQGLDSVVEAARISSERDAGITFMLVGDGNQRESLQLLGRGVPALRFIDPLSSDDYPFALAAADMLILNERPGVKEMSLPSKLTSYASAKRPIIAAVEPGGITHSILANDDAALFARPGDADGLLMAALSVARDREGARTLAANANDMYERNYSSTKARARYISFARTLGELARYASTTAPTPTY